MALRQRLGIVGRHQQRRFAVGQHLGDLAELRWRRSAGPWPCTRTAWSASRRTRRRRPACRAARPARRTRRGRLGISACGTIPAQRDAVASSCCLDGLVDERPQRPVAEQQPAHVRARLEHQRRAPARGSGCRARRRTCPKSRRRHRESQPELRAHSPRRRRRVGTASGRRRSGLTSDPARQALRCATSSSRSTRETTTTRSAARRLMRSTSCAGALEVAARPSSGLSTPPSC